jgi:nicotinate-nucleotide pyrophosphorylase (carboxylating)
MFTIAKLKDQKLNRGQNPPVHLEPAIEKVIHRALAEDLGIDESDIAKAATGSLLMYDLTSAATVSADLTTKAALIVKEPGVLAGLNVARAVFETVDPGTKFTIEQPEGTRIDRTPTTVATIEGKAAAVMLAERTALNLMQRLSGIASITAKYVEKAQKFGIHILDTRKTTPGLRALEKYAVELAGGTNHRFGLFDAILIKDNHISIAGGVTAAVKRTQEKFPGRPIEVEVANKEELAEALALDVEHIMLDNMNPAQVKEAIGIIAGRSFVEVSGGVTLQNIDEYLIDGVNAISIGALTHSVRSLDISLEIEG